MSFLHLPAQFLQSPQIALKENIHMASEDKPLKALTALENECKKQNGTG